MFETERRHKIDSVFVLLIFALFAASLLMVLLLGAQNYKTVADLNEATYDRRVCVQYIAAKVRHNDEAGSVFVADYYDPDKTAMGGMPALYLRQQTGGETYDTRIYFYDGYVRELFAESGLELEPGAGNTIMAVQEFGISKEGNLLSADFVDDRGEPISLNLMLRSGGEAVK